MNRPGHQGFAGGKTLGEDKINAGRLISSVVEFTPQPLGLLHAEGIDFAPPGGAVRGPRAI